MRTEKRLFIFALAILTAGGCDDSWGDDGDDEHECATPSSPIERASGALSNGRFEWICLEGSDPTCGSRVFPLAVAAGARFSLDFRTSSELPAGVGDPMLSAVGASLVGGDGTGFSAPLPGVATVVAVSEEAAIDFIEVEVLSVTRLSLSRTLPPPEPNEWGCTPGAPSPAEGERADLVVGDSFTVQVMPYAGSTRLGGGLDYTWESLTPDVLVVSNPGGRVARIDGLSEGIGQLVVRGGGHEEVFDVRVDAAPIPDETESAGTDGSTGGEDGSTGGEGESTGDGGTTGGADGTTGDEEGTTGGEEGTTGGEETSGGSK